MEEKAEFNGKEIIETTHFRNELYNKYRKTLDIAVEILKRRNHTKESKDKTMAHLRTKKGIWEVAFAETENNIILIYIKLRR